MTQIRTLIDEAVTARERGDYSRALALSEQIAEQGNPYGLVLLASMYMEGLGTRIDLDRAEELLDRAQKLGSREAVLQKSALWFDRGDMRRHFSALQEASRLGILPATYRLAICYAKGTGVERDDHKALQVMREAAASGHVGAKMYVGRKLLRNPLNLAGFVRGTGMLLSGFVETLVVGSRNPDDDRLR